MAHEILPVIDHSNPEHGTYDDGTCDWCDWCENCKKVQVYNGEHCSVCGRVWGGEGIVPIPVGDVWLKFDSPDDEEASHEANTYRVGTSFRIDWYHTAVGQVSSASLPSYADVEKWYADNGYQDFSS